MNHRTEHDARPTIVLGIIPRGERRLLAIVAAVTALALISFAVASAAQALSPTAVLRTEYRDGAALTVIGTVANARIWTTPSGIRYFRFHLSDGRVGLPIIFAGPTRCPEGGTATVIGLYRPARVVEGRLFQQHLEARTIHCEETAERLGER